MYFLFGRHPTSVLRGKYMVGANMLIKPPFSLVLCCFLLASLLCIRHGVVARRLLEVQENDNGTSKVGIRKSKPTTAPSWVGQNNPPSSQSHGVKTSQATCTRANRYNRDCLPPPNKAVIRKAH
ncbi:PREDICTED: uncharacterized protein LOC18610011 [Theobroma cacao]|uniref:Uncharacterized protein LOC18610011 n=1 Tax=Theobroma cacao TaxID=3641 RepID=A0AB32VZ63_THECC|nr:PREDICTED: uncharacterized protein LOC18610011 [Theobroma cacao]